MGVNGSDWKEKGSELTGNGSGWKKGDCESKFFVALEYICTVFLGPRL